MAKVLDFIRKVFVGYDKPYERVMLKYPTQGVMGGGSYGMDVGYGMKIPGLQEGLELEQDLTSRYIDSENFDDLPELCFSGETLVLTIGGPRRIGDLAKEGKDVKIVAFDKDHNEFVYAQAKKPRLTRKNAEVMEVVLDSGMSLIGTPNHKFMLLDGTYKRLCDLGARDSLKTYEKDVAEKVKDVHLASSRDVYDLTTEKYHNFIANGVVVHNSAALDIFSDDATQSDPITGRTVGIECDNEDVKHKLENLFEKNLRIDEDIWEIARMTCKYGNNFEEIVVKEDEGVVELVHLPPPSVRRIEDITGMALGFIQDMTGQFRVSTTDFFDRLKDKEKEQRLLDDAYMQGKPPTRVFEDWEVVHFRIRGKHRRTQYGISVLDSARWIVKRLALLEDSMLLYRLQRAPERFAFYVDVGDMPPNEVKSYINNVKNQFKKKKMIDPVTGQIDLKANILGADSDFFVPTRKGQDATRIETLGGFAYQGIDDINYFKDKMFSALKVPKDYLNFTEPGIAKANLSQEDVRFCRTVLRIQRELRNGLKKIGRVHLASLGVNPDVIDWDVTLVVPSSVFEMASYEVKNAQLDLAARYKGFASRRWIMKNILEFSDEDIDWIVQELKTEKAEFGGKGSREEESIDSNRWPYGNEAGIREHEKILSDNVEKIMKTDVAFVNRMKELKEFLLDLKAVRRARHG